MKLNNNQDAPRLGEAEIFLVHIGKDDYPVLKDKKVAFNMLLRRCGGIPITDPQPQFCASIAFTNNLYREDFVLELEGKIGITAVVDFARTFIDRRFLPPMTVNSDYDKDLMRMEKEKTHEERKQREEKAQQEETDYIYPEGGKQQTVE